MIRTRVALAVALVALLALIQAAFVWWAASQAAHHAERSVVATRMLAEYLELAGNKQRQKVWFAQRMLANDPDTATRERLAAAMRASVEQLRVLARPLEGEIGRFERAEVETVALNVEALERALRDAERPVAWLTPSEQWQSVIKGFDELAGRDMRLLLNQAMQRHEAASLRQSALLADALTRLRIANTLLALGVMMATAAAIAYFLRIFDAPFSRLAALSTALAAGDFRARSGLSGRDEFGRIGGLLDSMAAGLAQAEAHNAALRMQLDDLVSERTRALNEAHESLLGIEARRRQFFAELSHELRTPVTVIRGEADLALRNPGDANEQRLALQRISAAAIEVGDRIHDLLDAARSGRVEYAYAPTRCSLSDLVRASVVQMRALAEHRRVSLSTIGDWPTNDEVCIDRVRFQQAMVVVLDNALRYSPTDSRAEVSVEADGDSLAVHVDDQGPGMTDSERERAFEPHFRSDSARSKDPNGLGLGLAIARGILEGQLGGIDLQPRSPQGLRVTITLPWAPPQVDAS